MFATIFMTSVYISVPVVWRIINTTYGTYRLTYLLPKCLFKICCRPFNSPGASILEYHFSCFSANWFILIQFNAIFSRKLVLLKIYFDALWWLGWLDHWCVAEGRCAEEEWRMNMSLCADWQLCVLVCHRFEFIFLIPLFVLQPVHCYAFLCIESHCRSVVLSHKEYPWV
jgi:hypothetical protein